jgi:acyl-CoA reductase-like NAD-dependent aldehyde dehydrogenase
VLRAVYQFLMSVDSAGPWCFSRSCRVRAASRIVLTNVTPDMAAAVCDQIFGHAMTIQPYEDIGPIWKSNSDSPYGLQCGILGVRDRNTRSAT